jgi:hypothetical protein
MHPLPVGPGGDQAGHYGIAEPILGLQVHDVAERRAALVAGPRSSRRDPRRHEGEDLALTFVRETGDDAEFAQRKAVGPPPGDRVHRDVRRADALQLDRLPPRGRLAPRQILRRAVAELPEPIGDIFSLRHDAFERLRLLLRKFAPGLVVVLRDEHPLPADEPLIQLRCPAALLGAF